MPGQSRLSWRSNNWTNSPVNATAKILVRRGSPGIGAPDPTRYYFPLPSPPPIFSKETWLAADDDLQAAVMTTRKSDPDINSFWVNEAGPASRTRAMDKRNMLNRYDGVLTAVRLQAQGVSGAMG